MSIQRLLILPLLWLLMGCSPLATQPAMLAEPLSAEAETALLYLEQHRDQYRLREPRQQLWLQRQESDALGFSHLRFRQQRQDVPIWGDELLVHINKLGRVYRVDGVAVDQPEPATLEPHLSVEEAAQRGVAAMPGGAEAWQVKQSELYLYPDKLVLRLAYLVELNRGLMRQFVFIDANEGQLLKRVEGTPAGYR